MRESYPLAVQSARTRAPKWTDIFRSSISDYLHRHGLSLNAFAEATDVRQSVLHRFMTGERENLRIDTAEKLSHFLGLELRRIGEPEIRKTQR